MHVFLLGFENQKAENEENDPNSRAESPQSSRRKLVDEIYQEQLFEQTVQPKWFATTDREAVQKEYE